VSIRDTDQLRLGSRQHSVLEPSVNNKETPQAKTSFVTQNEIPSSAIDRCYTSCQLGPLR